MIPNALICCFVLVTSNGRATQGPAVIRGTVYDRESKPIRGAHVVHLNGRSTAEANTDEHGRFRVQGADPSTGFLIASRAGFHTSGQPFEPAGPTSITLARIDEPIPNRPRAKAATVTKRQRRMMAIGLIEPLLKGEGDLRFQALETLAEIDPDRALGQLEANPLENGYLNDSVRRRVALRLAKERPEEALAIVGAMKNSVMRTQVYLRVIESLRENQHEEQLALLAEALLLGRAEKAPAYRVVIFADVGERLLDLGERERSIKVLREGQALAEQLSNAALAGYSRGAFAAELAQVDLEAALNLCAELADIDEYNRHHGNIAHELAAIDPAAAERVLELMKPSRTLVIPAREEKSVRVCYRMVRIDRARAERIADSIATLSIRAYAKGLMAKSLVESDAKATGNAQRLIRDAFEVLEEASRREDRKPSVGFTPSTIAAALLPVVEQIDPMYFDNYLWKTILFRRSIRTEGGPVSNVTQASASELALLLSQCDPELASRVLGWIPAGSPRPGRAFLPAKTLLRPNDVVAEIEGGPDRNRGWNRLLVARFLTLTGESLQRAIRETTGLWYPDVEDLGS